MSVACAFVSTQMLAVSQIHIAYQEAHQMSLDTDFPYDMITSNPHTCASCQEVNIDIPENFIDGRRNTWPNKYKFSVSLPYTPDQIILRSEAGCPLFRWLADKQACELVEKGESDAKIELYFDYGEMHCAEAVTISQIDDRWYCELVAEPDDVVGSILTSNTPMESEVVSKETYATIRGWIHDCSTTHRICQRQAAPFVPSRLVSVGDLQHPHLKVCQPSEEAIQWCALSHCWGDDQPLKLTKSTYGEMLEGINFNELPQTLRDAVIVARNLGIRYIWIDCLCIIQDDTGDMARELPMMSQIFDTACLTIAAGSARSCYEGFLHDRHLPTKLQPFELRCKDHLGQAGRVIAVQDRWPLGLTEPIHERAWTFQEMLISPRVLTFRSDQIVWRCGQPHNIHTIGGNRTGEAVSSWYPGLLNHRLTDQFTWDLKSWDEVIEAYSQCNMTLQEDKLVALSALAADFAQRNKGRYIAGLWEYDLPQGLLWSSYNVKPRPIRWRAPSWSWASTENMVVYQKSAYPAQGGRIDAAIIAADIEPIVPGFTYGRIRSASLRVRCKLLRARRLPARMHFHDDFTSLLQIVEYQSLCSEAVRHCRVTEDEKLDPDSESHSEDLYCAKIAESSPDPTYHYGLVLKKVEESNRCLFARVGEFTYGYDCCDEDAFKNLEYQEIDLC